MTPLLYKTDTLFLCAFVAGLLVLTTLKSVQGLEILWIQNVQHYTDVAAAVDMFFSTWTSELNLTFLFFCQRLWAISRNIYLVSLIMALFVFALLASIVASVFTFSRDSRNRIWITIHLGTGFAGDLLLCVTTTYFLSNRSKQALPQTAGILNAIVKLTFQSAAPAALWALIHSIVSQAGNMGATTNAWSMIAIIANSLLPKLYAISAISTERTSGRRRMNNVELGMLSSSGHRGPIQVRAQVQTTQHTDDVLAWKTAWHRDSCSCIAIFSSTASLSTYSYTEPHISKKSEDFMRGGFIHGNRAPVSNSGPTGTPMTELVSRPVGSGKFEPRVGPESRGRSHRA
ncbi:hypothetical protein DFH09DRAFT_1222266 [Mycena vulgaris]|nr:hypothetical protein DFH09DRAFT_1222266 [Mycena vulgaris]